MHNMSFDKSQYRVVQSCRVHTPNVHTSPTYFEEWVIISDVQKHRETLADVTRAYAKVTSLSVWFLIPENEHMAKELQAAN